MDDMLRVAAVALVAGIAALLIKKENPAGSLLLVIAAACVIGFLVVRFAAPVRGFLDMVAEAAGVSAAVTGPLFRALAVAIITKVTSETCRDAGQKGIAAAVEVAGTAIILYTAMPLISTVLELVGSFL